MKLIGLVVVGTLTSNTYMDSKSAHLNHIYPIASLHVLYLENYVLFYIHAMHIEYFKMISLKWMNFFFSHNLF